MSIAARGLFLRVLARVAVVVGTIEIVFLAEKATGVLEEVLGNGGRVPSALLILLMTSPEIFDFALALACVIGGYFAFSAAREERELVALSAAGVSWQLPLRVALALGIVAGGSSLVVSGFLDPLSRHATRSAVFELKSDLLFRRLTEPSDGTLVETIRGRTFAALSDASVSPPHESLFVHQPGAQGSWRVTQAGNWSLIGPDSDGNYDLGLGRVIAYDFVPVAREGTSSVLSAGGGQTCWRWARGTWRRCPCCRGSRSRTFPCLSASTTSCGSPSAPTSPANGRLPKPSSEGATVARPAQKPGNRRGTQRAGGHGLRCAHGRAGCLRACRRRTCRFHRLAALVRGASRA